MVFTVAAAQYPIDQLRSWEEYVQKITSWVCAAVERGARLVVFPEYGSMELASLDPSTMSDLAKSLAFVSSLIPEVDALHANLAATHDMHILAASAPVLLTAFDHDDNKYVNRARLFTPHGAVGIQDKLIMTRFERSPWGISAGATLRLFRTSLGMIGITICYDSEFPLLARALVEAGMQLLLVPSCTEKPHGYYRVKIGAQARALEGQCYVVHSPTVGAAPWSPSVDTNYGAAAIYSPPDSTFPDDGIVSIGVMNQSQLVCARIDLTHVQQCRQRGEVLNMAHWAEQPGAEKVLPAVEVVDLRPPIS